MKVFNMYVRTAAGGTATMLCLATTMSDAVQKYEDGHFELVTVDDVTRPYMRLLQTPLKELDEEQQPDLERLLSEITQKFF